MRHHAFSLLLVLASATGLAALHAADSVPDESALRIAARGGNAGENVVSKAAAGAGSGALRIGARESLKSGLADGDFQREIENIALELGGAETSPAHAPETESIARAALAKQLRREPGRCGAAFARLLDPRLAPNPKVRKGAAVGIGLCQAETKTVGKALGYAALSETDAGARAAAIAVIRQRRDPLALYALMAKLAEATDPDGLGIINEKQRDQALAALHDIGDRRIYSALLYYVTLEIRAGTASLQSLGKVFITNSGDVNNGAVGQSSVNLPIDLPTLELNSVQGTIVVPAICQPRFALRKVTGQDFGGNIAQWRAWIDQQPEIRH